MKYKNKKVLVLGLGKSGLAAVKLLLKEGAQVFVSDTSQEKDLLHNLCEIGDDIQGLETDGHTKEFCSKAEIVVTSPGIDTDLLVKKGILSSEQLIIGELEFAWQYSDAFTIAVTGTNGKSTTSALIFEMLKASGKDVRLCGNIGTPLSEIVSTLTEKSILVLEVSSFQLETIRSFAPDIALILNIEEDHLKRHGSFSNYARIKFRIFEYQKPGSWALIHGSLRDRKELSGINSNKMIFGKSIYNGSAPKEKFSVVSPLAKDQKAECDVSELSLKGGYNMDNMESACLAAFLAGADKKAITETLSSFRSLPHRCQKLARLDGVEFTDDSKATNIDAAMKSISSFENRVILIAGGKDKGGDYAKALPVFREKLKAVVAIGEAKKKIKDAFISYMPVVFASDMDQAVAKAFSIAESGEAVVLAPMCSSYDMYKNYEERGRSFYESIILFSLMNPKSFNL